MTYEELKNIGIKNLLSDASTKNLAIEHECFLAKWALTMALHLATTENMNTDLINALTAARLNWGKDNVPPQWNALIDLVL